MTGVSAEDAAIARQQGDLKQLILVAAGFFDVIEQPPAPEPEPEVAIPRDRRGAWPTGASRPAPVAPVAGPVIAAALDEYRDWYLGGRPKCDERCNCPGCTPTPA